MDFERLEARGRWVWEQGKRWVVRRLVDLGWVETVQGWEEILEAQVVVVEMARGVVVREKLGVVAMAVEVAVDERERLVEVEAMAVKAAVGKVKLVAEEWERLEAERERLVVEERERLVAVVLVVVVVEREKLVGEGRRYVEVSRTQVEVAEVEGAEGSLEAAGLLEAVGL